MPQDLNLPFQAEAHGFLDRKRPRSGCCGADFRSREGESLLGEFLGFDTATIDYAGGTAVHINAGAAALALAIVLGKRLGFQKGIQKPHNVPLVLLGAALLWFGWFGFNAGAEGTFGLLGTEDSRVGLIVINTLGATAAAIVGWLVIEKIKVGKPTSVGAVSGAVAGLVAITPACADLAPGWALVLGLITGAVCCFAVELKWLIAIQGVGGV